MGLGSKAIHQQTPGGTSVPAKKSSRQYRGTARPLTKRQQLGGGLCCKSILSISAGNIDSRSSASTQQRFKRTGAPIQLFQISISQSPLGDFCNTIGQQATLPRKLLRA